MTIKMRNVVYYKKHNIMVYSRKSWKSTTSHRKKYCDDLSFYWKYSIKLFLFRNLFLFLFIVDKSCKIHRRGVEQTCENVDYIAWKEDWNECSEIISSPKRKSGEEGCVKNLTDERWTVISQPQKSLCASA